MRSGIAALLLCCGVALPAQGQPATSPCGPRYTERTSLDLHQVLSAPRPAVSQFWGRENIRLLPAEAGAPGPVLRITYPAGSINPGNPRAPTGGAGFLLPPGPGREARCLRYSVRFAPGFDFVRGGKLPGLYGGEAPRGCRPGELALGFSARLMWREEGAGELYLYAPDRGTRCGESAGRHAWRFPRGAWTSIAQEVVLNAPGRADGAIRLWVDGRPVLERTGLVLRERAEGRVEGLIFSTFFGGSDASWASPRDQWADFAAFELWEEAAR